MLRPTIVGLVLVVGTLAAGCATGDVTLTTQPPKPAGATPSPIARQVCSHEAQTELADALGETARVSTPTWSDHLYSCTYSYPTAAVPGSYTLSVKELSSWPETYAYFNGLAAKMGKANTLEAIGQGAFQTTDGSVVVRKDWKVLLVDASGLPAHFGVPPTSSAAVAVTVADVILGCWAGD